MFKFLFSFKLLFFTLQLHRDKYSSDSEEKVEEEINKKT